MKTPHGFRTGRIRVNCKRWYDDSGEVEIDALIRGELAAHEGLGGYSPWTVTHIPTGRVITFAKSQDDAIVAIRKLERVCNWRRVRYDESRQAARGIAKANVARIKAIKIAFESAP
jgi:hypothetical protein